MTIYSYRSTMNYTYVYTYYIDVLVKHGKTWPTSIYQQLSTFKCGSIWAKLFALAAVQDQVCGQKLHQFIDTRHTKHHVSAGSCKQKKCKANRCHSGNNNLPLHHSTQSMGQHRDGFIRPEVDRSYWDGERYGGGPLLGVPPMDGL